MTWVRLSEVAEINPRGDRLDADAEISFVGMAELDAERAVARTLQLRPFREVSKGYTPFRNGDLLAAKITPCWENGKVGIAEIATPVGAGSTEFHVVRPGGSVDRRYLLHFLRGAEVRATGTLRMTGSGGQRRVPVRYLEQLELDLPPLSEQRRIAAILDQAETLRAKRRQVLSRLDELTSAAFQSCFGDPVAWLDGREMVSIGSLTSDVQYGTSAKSGESGEWPILRMGNVTDRGTLDLADLKYIDLAPSEVAKYTVRRGDLLFNRTNSREKVGKTCVVETDEPLAVAGYLVRVRFREAGMADYINGYMTSAHGIAVRRRLAKAAVNQANISASEFKNIRVAVPDRESLLRYHELCSKISAQRAEVVRAMGSDDCLVRSLQTRAFRGEL